MVEDDELVQRVIGTDDPFQEKADVQNGEQEDGFISEGDLKKGQKAEQGAVECETQTSNADKENE